MKDALYIGMMSGTSMDAVDCALVEVGENHPPRLLDFHSPPLPAALRRRLLALCAAEVASLRELGELDVELGELFARTALDLLDRRGLASSAITAIGSHGQTVHHQPRRGADDATTPFTLQIADPNVISERTGITTVADFRRRDIAAGGQGAPLVPAFHRAVFRSPDVDRIILNVGGIANLTVLRAGDERTPAWDTGPGNVLMDFWVQAQRGEPFDADGEWAASGRCDEALLRLLLDDEDYFRLPPPKSTGRELFNGQWLERRLQAHRAPCDARDVQATLLELTARSVAREVERAGRGGELIVCGGGARNGQLMTRLAQLLPAFRVLSSDALGLHADCVEAVAFAWMASLTLAGQTLDLRAVTGARHPCVLGGIYGLEAGKRVGA